MSGSKRPWWQVTKTPKFSFVLGILWAIMATLEWVQVVTEKGSPDWPWRTILAPLMTLLAVIYLVSAVKLRRQQRNKSR